MTALALAGAANAAAPGSTDRIVINELQPNPHGTDRGHEWVEIYNPAPVAQPLDGWFLQDHRGRIHALDERVAPALGYLVIVLDGTLQLVNSGGDLQLVNGDGAIVDRIRYGDVAADDVGAHEAPGSGESLARYFVHGDGRFATAGDDGEWYVDENPTPGGPNKFLAPLS